MTEEMPPQGSRPATWLAVVAGASLLASCAPAEPSRFEAVFQVRACRGSLHAPQGEIFRILLRDRQRIYEARALVGVGNRRIVAGAVRAGNGGFNAPWNWHLDPETVVFPQVAVELCDGCPSFVIPGTDNSSALGFCPWTSEVLAEEQ